MKRIFLILCLMVLHLASNAQQPQKTVGPQLLSFHDIPKIIDGGTCLFALSMEEYQRENYILVNDMGLYCCINCDGIIHTLELVRYDEKTGSFHYQDRDIRVTIQIVQQEYQTEFMKARVLVENSVGSTNTTIVGKCDS